MHSKFILGWLLTGLTLAVQAQTAAPIADEFIVRFTEATTVARQAEIAAAVGVTVDRSLRLPHTVVIKLRPGTSADAALPRLREFAEVRYVEPNEIMHIENR